MSKDLRYSLNLFTKATEVFPTVTALARWETIEGMSNTVKYKKDNVIGSIMFNPISGNYILFNNKDVVIDVSRNIETLMNINLEYLIHKENELNFMTEDNTIRLMSVEELITYAFISEMVAKGMFCNKEFVLKIVDKENNFRIGIGLAQACSSMFKLQYVLEDDYLLLANSSLDMKTNTKGTINIVKDYEKAKKALILSTIFLKQYMVGNKISTSSMESVKVAALRDYIERL